VRADFTTGAKIGAGAYGTVFKVNFVNEATEKRIQPLMTGKPNNYALKEMLIHRFLQEGRMREVFIERCILASLDHPLIIKFFQSFKNANKLYLLVEYCPRGSLGDFLKRQGSLNNIMTKNIAA
jgi:cell division control protein CDC15